jgi:ABC-type multidrug transport system fused ATPase/permease subunit
LQGPPEIVFENVSFRYPSSENWVLRDVSFRLEPNKKIALVGNNGAGKTTLTKLLCRIYDPTEGRILVNGIDLREVNLEEWWSALGVMLQDYSSYDFPVKQAIAVGRSDKQVDIDQVKKSAEISQAAEFIGKWKQQYENPMGVEFGGEEPSKGQRQKLAIAKILYRNAFVMVLDEPTASVDAESEAKIFDSLESLSGNMTSIFISHDFSTISQCDQIIVMEEGRVKEIGNHDQLVANNSTYADLYKLQAKRFR